MLVDVASYNLLEGWHNSCYYVYGKLVIDARNGIVSWRNNKRHGYYASELPDELFVTVLSYKYPIHNCLLRCTWVDGFIHGEIRIYCKCHDTIDVKGYFSMGIPCGNWYYFSKLAEPDFLS